MRRQLNAWNWSATAYVYVNDFKDYVTAFDTEQHWDGTRRGHERLMAALVERLEGQRDRLGFQYRLHQPTAIKYESWAEKLPEFIEIG